VVIDYFQEGATEPQPLIAWQNYELRKQNLLLRCFFPFFDLVFKDTGIAHHFVIHVAHKVVPIWVVGVYKAGAVDVKLEKSLESAVYFTEIFRVALDFHDLESFYQGLLWLASLFLNG
jgi:hypothetical protein